MRSKSRSTTSEKRPMSHRVTSASTGIWPPHTGMPPNFQQRSVTPDPWPPMPNSDRLDRITQRPKTVSYKKIIGLPLKEKMMRYFQAVFCLYVGVFVCMFVDSHALL